MATQKLVLGGVEYTVSPLTVLGDFADFEDALRERRLNLYREASKSDPAAVRAQVTGTILGGAFTQDIIERELDSNWGCRWAIDRAIKKVHKDFDVKAAAWSHKEVAECMRAILQLSGLAGGPDPTQAAAGAGSP